MSSYQQALPLPNPDDWISPAGAAQILKLSLRTLERRIADGVLKSYLPFGAWDVPSSRILWRPEVEAYGRAMATVKEGAR